MSARVWFYQKSFFTQHSLIMVYACYLCNRKASKNDNISLHGFPKDPALCQRWKQTCGLTEKDDVSRVYICSAHFSTDHHEKVDALQQPRIRLKKGAVPSISVPVATLTPPASSPNVQNRISDHSHRSMEVAAEIDTSRSEKNCGSPFMEIGINNDENIPHATSNESNIPRKRRFAEPRFISEISSSDFSTPKRTRRVLNLVKETDAQKSRTIKRLQDQVLRLKKRIVSLQDLVQHLTDKGLMTEEAGDNLLVTYSLN